MSQYVTMMTQGNKVNKLPSFLLSCKMNVRSWNLINSFSTLNEKRKARTHPLMLDLKF